MELEIGRTIRLIDSKENGLELIKEFLGGYKLIKKFKKETRECFVYKKCEEEYLVELFLNENINKGYIRIEKISLNRGGLKNENIK